MVPKRRFVVDDPRVAEFVSRSVGSTDTQAHRTIGLEVDGQIAAGVVFDNFSGPNIFVHFSNATGLSMPRCLLRLMFGYAFRALRVKRVSAAFPATHTKVRRLAELCGFQREAVLHGASRSADGHETDMVIYCLREARCRFLPEVKRG